MNEKRELPLFDEVSNDLERLNLPAHGSECHGAICGYLCANRGEDFSYWFTHVLYPMVNESTEQQTASNINKNELNLIEQLFCLSAEQLSDIECGLRLLLPNDDEELSERADALAEWCQGFIYGLTVMAADEISQFSAEAQEVLADIVKISQSGLDSGEATDEDEAAYAEIMEYVRIGALLIWSDARSLQRSANDKPQLH